MADTAVSTRKRVVITSAVAMFAVYMALPILASTTSVLDGAVGGIGIAYVFGFVVMVGAYLSAVVYCRWAERVAVAIGTEEAADAAEAG